ncbi:alpha/beta hydrolase [Nannizzia gypsea CBS 118893]|uniref:Alpha/beta hydrolase n=1 Tax=Arthroderma gypseum (strain ATCC MYA-4604 / CBS 118893) TaxID=535722 RepID=E4UZJ3_ARTGP|nr:alpha/beta hydrolase [Nannizzia gypsea CBS 118893]EFR03523.1 alpha/beta hydrolase [Nannizzia gypsea CBS 118893]
MVVLGVAQCLAGHGLSTFEVCDPESGSTIRGLSRGLAAATGADAEKPVVVLIHGYPQTWRHVIKLLPRETRLFVPDIPGYGASSPPKASDKRAVGKAILVALETLLEVSNENTSTTTDGRPQRIVLVGHDRGARICHRLTVDAADHAPSFTILATALMDIVPTSVQWAALADPAEARNTFHWPLLANVELASAMIGALGADVFVRLLMERWRGSSSAAISRFEADDAMEVYSRPFRQLESVVRSSCADYEAGGGQDVEEQARDQAEGRRMGVPVLVLHCRGMGQRFGDVQRAWQAWVEREPLLTVVQTGEGVGHFVAEEDPEATVGAMQRWLAAISLAI